ncbi:MAG: S-layer homology domain-containing protein [Oscillibacter sp.]|nr:S-layer homology domain-containing protein [Oscillibacter sp.]
MKRARKRIAGVLAVLLLLPTAAFAAETDGAGALPFTDVARGAWCEDAIREAYERGLMLGVSETAFAPDATLTRSQFVTVLWRLAGSPVVNYALPYSDVGEDFWCADAVRWAAAEKITDRTEGAFGIIDPLLRDEAAFLLYNTAKALGAEGSGYADAGVPLQEDAPDAREAYAPALRWAVGAGILKGYSSRLLAPLYALTRAQAAVMLRRFTANAA